MLIKEIVKINSEKEDDIPLTKTVTSLVLSILTKDLSDSERHDVIVAKADEMMETVFNYLNADIEDDMVNKFFN